MKRQIEDYLRARGVPYFRGHHDDEYFFLVDFVAGAERGRLNVQRAERGRLNVHLEVTGGESDVLVVTISPDRYYPAGIGERLGTLVARWNDADPVVRAVVHGSCDPHLIGIRARGEIRTADPGELRVLVDAAVAEGIDLFGRITTAAGSTDAGLRDAG